jgi:hypothetical protein
MSAQRRPLLTMILRTYLTVSVFDKVLAKEDAGTIPQGT